MPASISGILAGFGLLICSYCVCTLSTKLIILRAEEKDPFYLAMFIITFILCFNVYNKAEEVYKDGKSTLLREQKLR